MTNAEHLAILGQGVEAWNQWRKQNSNERPILRNTSLRGLILNGIDLHEAILIGSDLCGVSLCNANLQSAVLSTAILYGSDLHRANLFGCDLRWTNLQNVFLRGSDLRNADLAGANLADADLSQAKLCRANLTKALLAKAELSRADFSMANLTQAELIQAILIGTNFTGANLTEAGLTATQALATNFENAILTGACIEDWHIHEQTNLNGVDCKYVYFENQQQERRPSDPSVIFSPGEFTILVQKALSTVDLIFRDGIDWRAFFASFQALQAQYADRHLSIQAIERKDYAFVIRLEVDADADKGAIERGGMALYAEQVKQYERIIDLQGRQLDDYRNLLKEQRWQNIELTGAVKTLAEQQPKPTYNLQGAKFGGGFAADGGMAIGGTFNDFSQNIEQNLSEIDRLVRSLHSLSQTLPAAQQIEAIEHLNNLQAELKTPDKRKPSYLKESVAALLAIGLGLGGAIATATDFANNVYELSDKLGVPLERVQPAQQP